MSQAEFARALGWAPSTIARWESGRSRPSRLALKIILAFGEEHHVRYRPRQQLPVPIQHPPVTVQRPPLIDPASREMTVIAAHPALSTHSDSGRTDRPGWEAELKFRVARTPRELRSEGPRRGWLRPAIVMGASLCVLAAVGIPLLSGGPAPATSSQVATSPQPSLTAPVPVPSPRHRRRERAEVPTEDNSAATTELGQADGGAPPPPAPLAPEAPPVMARLEGVTMLDGVHQATFRIAREIVTVAEGEELGTRRAERISVDGVDLRDGSGVVRTVRLGGQVPLD